MRLHRLVRLAFGAALLALAGGVLAACSVPDRLGDPDAGRTVAYDPDTPDLDLEARATQLREGSTRQPGLHVLVAFAPSALVFQALENTLQARYQLAVVVRDAASERVVSERVWTDTLTVASPDAARAAPTVLHEARMALAAGTYLVEARLDDLGVEREGVRRLRLEVPPPGSGPGAGRLLVEVKREGRYVPHLARTLGATPDSLRVRAEVWEAPAGTSTTLRVERLPSDTTVARPPHWLGPSRGSLVFQGVRVTEGDRVFEVTRRLDAAEEHTEYVLELPPLAPGLYRLRVETRLPGEGEPVHSATRTLAVLAPAFPRVETLDQLIDALAYIAYERELEFIQAGPTPQERRARFDGFWGTLIGDRRVAANVVRLYYERIEEATRRFTSVKEGWKTDRGMLFVLLGPPAYVEREPDGETWYYGSGLRQDATTFRFEHVDGFGQPRGWQPYVLARSVAYEQVWVQSLRRWRQGRVL